MRPVVLLFAVAAGVAAADCSFGGVSEQCCAAMTSVQDAIGPVVVGAARDASRRREEMSERKPIDAELLRRQCCDPSCRDAMQKSFPFSSAICAALEDEDTCRAGQRRQAVDLFACTPMDLWSASRTSSWANGYGFNGTALERAGVTGRALRSMAAADLRAVPGINAGEVQHILEAAAGDAHSKALADPPALDACSKQKALDKPTNVYVSIYFDRLLSVDDSDHTFEAVVWLFYGWLDDRVQFVPEATPFELAACPVQNLCGPLCAAGRPCRSFRGTSYSKCCTGLWKPKPVVRNAVETKTIVSGGPIYTSLGADIGEVGMMFEQIRARMHTPMSLSDFPFDTQWLEMTVGESEQILKHQCTRISQGRSGVKFIGDVSLASRASFSSSLSQEDFTRILAELPSWTTFEVTPGWDAVRSAVQGNDIITNFTFGSQNPLSPVINAGASDATSVTCLLGAKRQPYYYTTSIIVPVVLLNILNFLTFFLDSEHVETKVKSSGILMVALLAFQSTVAPSLPVTGYPTALHQFMLYSQFFILVGAIHSVVVYTLFYHRVMPFPPSPAGFLSGLKKVLFWGPGEDSKDVCDDYELNGTLKLVDDLFCLTYVFAYCMMMAHFFAYRELWIAGLTLGLFSAFAIPVILILAFKRLEKYQKAPRSRKQSLPTSPERTEPNQLYYGPASMQRAPGQPWGWKPQSHPGGSMSQQISLSPLREASNEDVSPPVSPNDNNVSGSPAKPPSPGDSGAGVQPGPRSIDFTAGGELASSQPQAPPGNLTYSREPMSFKPEVTPRDAAPVPADYSMTPMMTQQPIPTPGPSTPPHHSQQQGALQQHQPPPGHYQSAAPTSKVMDLQEGWRGPSTVDDEAAYRRPSPPQVQQYGAGADVPVLAGSGVGQGPAPVIWG